MLQPPLQEFNDQEIKTAFRQGQSEVLGLIYDKYAAVLLGLATRIMQNQEAAEMVLQKTFILIWQQRAEYEKTPLSLISWLILLTRDTAMTVLKSDLKSDPRRSAEINPKKDFTDEKRHDGPAAIQVKEKFCNLAPNEKSALDLVYLQGYSCTEAAAALGIAEETLKDWLKTASRHLREGIGK